MLGSQFFSVNGSLCYLGPLWTRRKGKALEASRTTQGDEMDVLGSHVLPGSAGTKSRKPLGGWAEAFRGSPKEDTLVLA